MHYDKSLLHMLLTYEFAGDFMIHTELCSLLKIEYPIVQPGMGVFTSAELVAAVSNAGGIGILGA